MNICFDVVSQIRGNGILDCYIEGKGTPSLKSISPILDIFRQTYFLGPTLTTHHINIHDIIFLLHRFKISHT